MFSLSCFLCLLPGNFFKFSPSYVIFSLVLFRFGCLLCHISYCLLCRISEQVPGNEVAAVEALRARARETGGRAGSLTKAAGASLSVPNSLPSLLSLQFPLLSCSHIALCDSLSNSPSLRLARPTLAQSAFGRTISRRIASQTIAPTPPGKISPPRLVRIRLYLMPV
jgi:hypothetical protein